MENIYYGIYVGLGGKGFSHFVVRIPVIVNISQTIESDFSLHFLYKIL